MKTNLKLARCILQPVPILLPCLSILFGPVSKCRLLKRRAGLYFIAAAFKKIQKRKEKSCFVLFFFLRLGRSAVWTQKDSPSLMDCAGSEVEVWVEERPQIEEKEDLKKKKKSCIVVLSLQYQLYCLLPKLIYVGIFCRLKQMDMHVFQ